jgi:hypothetical protein
MVKFFRGPAASFDKVLHKDGLYFAIDKGEIYLNDSVYGSDETVTDVEMTEDGTALIVRRKGLEDKTIDLVELMAKASTTSAGLMTAADKIALDELSAAFKNDELGKVQGVAEGDKILSMNDKLISATVSLTYDSETKKIKLLGKDNADLGSVDATPFIKDGMISEATLVTDPEGQESGKYLMFKWNTDSGVSDPTYVPLTELVDVYIAGDAIAISENNEISVVVAESTEAQTNYLVNDGGLKVAEMGAGVTKLSQDIQVVGGPLADDLAGIFDGDVIPAGTSVETILMKMICKEIFPTASTSQGSISASMSLTTLAFNPTDTTVEVGTIVTTNALTANNSNYSTTPAKITGLTNGYSLTESGDKVTGNMEFAVEGVSEASNNHKITFTYTGFTETAPTAVEAASTVTMPAQTLVVREGKCKVSVSASGSNFTATSPTVSQTYYNISNVNTRQAETKTISTKSLSATASATTSDEVTGVYKYFMGYYDFASNQVVEDVFTSDIIRGLTVNTGDITKDDTTTLVGSTAKTSNGKSIVIAVPSKYKLATFQNDLGGDEVVSFSKTGTVAVANPTNKDFTTNYTVYV